MEVVRSLTRRTEIGYHLAEAEAWLAASDGGERTTLLAYAAFELRLEIERLAIELLGRIQNGLSADDWSTLQTFGRIENRIYELEGHQRILDRKIELFNILLEALQSERRLQAINLGSLRHAWHTCSDLCHITWSLIAATPAAREVCRETFASLTAIQRDVRAIVDGGIVWPRVSDPAFAELQERFIAGQIDRGEVLSWLGARGLWAQVVRPDGTTEVTGVAVPPPAG